MTVEPFVDQPHPAGPDLLEKLIPIPDNVRLHGNYLRQSDLDATPDSPRVDFIFPSPTPSRPPMSMRNY
jgi:hypothetical protein